MPWLRPPTAQPRTSFNHFADGVAGTVTEFDLARFLVADAGLESEADTALSRDSLAFSIKGKARNRATDVDRDDWAGGVEFRRKIRDYSRKAA